MRDQDGRAGPTEICPGPAGVSVNLNVNVQLSTSPSAGPCGSPTSSLNRQPGITNSGTSGNFRRLTVVCSHQCCSCC